MNDVDPAFLAFLQDEESRSYDGTLLEDVDAAIKSYNGAEYGDEEEGRSQVVARDVAETVDYMLTSLVDTFVASGRVAEFEPQSEQDEDAADDATEALHYLYRKKSGYRFIHDWIKSGLLEKIGIAKTCVERKRKRVEGLYHPAMMPDNAIEAQETGEPHPVDGSPMIHAVTLEETAATFRDYAIPLEEFRFAADTTTDLDESVYLAHIPQKSISQLTEMGFDVTDLDLSQGSPAPATALAQSRNDGRNSWYGALDREGPNRKVQLNEEYVLYDLNGDGIAERLCVHRVGNTVLAVEETDYQPFEYWCPFPMQGRLIGQSLADKTTDIQRVNTVLERNMLDSLYFATAPGTYVHEDSFGDHTLDDLLTVRPGRVVRWAGSVEPRPEERPDVSQFAMAAIEFKIRQRESRTGITRLNKGVDDDVLNETASGQQALMSRGQQMERYVVRNAAEGVARLFMKKVGLLRKHGQQFQIRVDGVYRTVDPSQWPEDMEVNVQVGLGSGSKQEKIMYRNMIAQAQTLLMQGQAPICTWENVFNNLTAGAKDMGLAPNDLFTEVPKDEQGNPIPPPPPPPDPKVMALQMQVQVKQQQIEQQRQDNQAKIEQMAQQHGDEAQLEVMRQHMEAALEIRQQNLQSFIDQQSMVLDAHKHAAQMDNQAKIAKMRPGGKLDK